MLLGIVKRKATRVGLKETKVCLCLELHSLSVAVASADASLSAGSTVCFSLERGTKRVTTNEISLQLDGAQSSSEESVFSLSDQLLELPSTLYKDPDTDLYQPKEVLLSLRLVKKKRGSFVETQQGGKSGVVASHALQLHELMREKDLSHCEDHATPSPLEREIDIELSSSLTLHATLSLSTADEMPEDASLSVSESTSLQQRDSDCSGFDYEDLYADEEVQVSNRDSLSSVSGSISVSSAPSSATPARRSSILQRRPLRNLLASQMRSDTKDSLGEERDSFNERESEKERKQSRDKDGTFFGEPPKAFLSQTKQPSFDTKEVKEADTIDTQEVIRKSIALSVEDTKRKTRRQSILMNPRQQQIQQHRERDAEAKQDPSNSPSKVDNKEVDSESAGQAIEKECETTSENCTLSFDEVKNNEAVLACELSHSNDDLASSTRTSFTNSVDDQDNHQLSRSRSMWQQAIFRTAMQTIRSEKENAESERQKLLDSLSRSTERERAMLLSLERERVKEKERDAMLEEFEKAREEFQKTLADASQEKENLLEKVNALAVALDAERSKREEVEANLRKAQETERERLVALASEKEELERLLAIERNRQKEREEEWLRVREESESALAGLATELQTMKEKDIEFQAVLDQLREKEAQYEEKEAQHDELLQSVQLIKLEAEEQQRGKEEELRSAREECERLTVAIQDLRSLLTIDLDAQKQQLEEANLHIESIRSEKDEEIAQQSKVIAELQEQLRSQQSNEESKSTNESPRKYSARPVEDEEKFTAVLEEMKATLLAKMKVKEEERDALSTELLKVRDEFERAIEDMTKDEEVLIARINTLEMELEAAKATQETEQERISMLVTEKEEFALLCAVERENVREREMALAVLTAQYEEKEVQYDELLRSVHLIKLEAEEQLRCKDEEFRSAKEEYERLSTVLADRQNTLTEPRTAKESQGTDEEKFAMLNSEKEEFERLYLVEREALKERVGEYQDILIQLREKEALYREKEAQYDELLQGVEQEAEEELRIARAECERLSTAMNDLQNEKDVALSIAEERERLLTQYLERERKRFEEARLLIDAINHERNEEIEQLKETIVQLQEQLQAQHVVTERAIVAAVLDEMKDALHVSLSGEAESGASVPQPQPAETEETEECAASKETTLNSRCEPLSAEEDLTQQIWEIEREQFIEREKLLQQKVDALIALEREREEEREQFIHKLLMERESEFDTERLSMQEELNKRECETKDLAQQLLRRSFALGELEKDDDPSATGSAKSRSREGTGSSSTRSVCSSTASEDRDGDIDADISTLLERVLQEKESLFERVRLLETEMQREEELQKVFIEREKAFMLELKKEREEKHAKEQENKSLVARLKKEQNNSRLLSEQLMKEQDQRESKLQSLLANTIVNKKLEQAREEERKNYKSLQQIAMKLKAKVDECERQKDEEVEREREALAKVQQELHAELIEKRKLEIENMHLKSRLDAVCRDDEFKLQRTLSLNANFSSEREKDHALSTLMSGFSPRQWRKQRDAGPPRIEWQQTVESLALQIVSHDLSFSSEQQLREQRERLGPYISHALPEMSPSPSSQKSERERRLLPQLLHPVGDAASQCAQQIKREHDRATVFAFSAASGMGKTHTLCALGRSHFFALLLRVRSEREGVSLERDFESDEDVETDIECELERETHALTAPWKTLVRYLRRVWSLFSGGDNVEKERQEQARLTVDLLLCCCMEVAATALPLSGLSSNCEKSMERKREFLLRLCLQNTSESIFDEVFQLKLNECAAERELEDLLDREKVLAYRTKVLDLLSEQLPSKNGGESESERREELLLCCEDVHLLERKFDRERGRDWLLDLFPTDEPAQCERKERERDVLVSALLSSMSALSKDCAHIRGVVSSRAPLCGLTHSAWRIQTLSVDTFFTLEHMISLLGHYFAWSVKPLKHIKKNLINKIKDKQKKSEDGAFDASNSHKRETNVSSEALLSIADKLAVFAGRPQFFVQAVLLPLYYRLPRAVSTHKSTEMSLKPSILQNWLETSQERLTLPFVSVLERFYSCALFKVQRDAEKLQCLLLSCMIAAQLGDGRLSLSGPLCEDEFLSPRVFCNGEREWKRAVLLSGLLAVSDIDEQERFLSIDMHREPLVRQAVSQFMRRALPRRNALQTMMSLLTTLGERVSFSSLPSLSCSDRSCSGSLPGPESEYQSLSTPYSSSPLLSAVAGKNARRGPGKAEEWIFTRKIVLFVQYAKLRNLSPTLHDVLCIFLDTPEERVFVPDVTREYLCDCGRIVDMSSDAERNVPFERSFLSRFVKRNHTYDFSCMLENISDLAGVDVAFLVRHVMSNEARVVCLDMKNKTKETLDDALTMLNPGCQYLSKPQRDFVITQLYETHYLHEAERESFPPSSSSLVGLDSVLWRHHVAFCSEHLQLSGGWFRVVVSARSIPTGLSRSLEDLFLGHKPSVFFSLTRSEEKFTRIVSSLKSSPIVLLPLSSQSWWEGETESELQLPKEYRKLIQITGNDVEELL